MRRHWLRSTDNYLQLLTKVSYKLPVEPYTQECTPAIHVDRGDDRSLNIGICSLLSFIKFDSYDSTMTNNAFHVAVCCDAVLLKCFDTIAAEALSSSVGFCKLFYFSYNTNGSSPKLLVCNETCLCCIRQQQLVSANVKKKPKMKMQHLTRLECKEDEWVYKRIWDRKKKESSIVMDMQVTSC